MVDNVREVKWNVEAFKLLVLPKATKDLIQSLVGIRASKSGMSQVMKRQDITNSKGQGLIMLLHGGPGTGKTLTAGKKHQELPQVTFFSMLTPLCRKVILTKSNPDMED